MASKKKSKKLCSRPNCRRKFVFHFSGGGRGCKVCDRLFQAQSEIGTFRQWARKNPIKKPKTAKQVKPPKESEAPTNLSVPGEETVSKWNVAGDGWVEFNKAIPTAGALMTGKVYRATSTQAEYFVAAHNHEIECLKEIYRAHIKTLQAALDEAKKTNLGDQILKEIKDLKEEVKDIKDIVDLHYYKQNDERYDT